MRQSTSSSPWPRWRWPGRRIAQSFESKDWQVVCDNTRACRAAGYSAEGSDTPVSVLLSRASGPGMPVVGELQLGTLDARAVRPAQRRAGDRRPAAGTIRIDQDNHADAGARRSPPRCSRRVVGGADVSFSAGKTTWRLSADGAADVLAARSTMSRAAPAGLRRWCARAARSDADVASPMAVPRFEAGAIPAASPAGRRRAGRARAGHASAATRDCPLLDDGAAQAQARLWHLDANRLLVTQACRAAAYNAGNGYWIANLRPPFDAKPMTYSGARLRRLGHASPRTQPRRAAGDCGSAQAWTWNGYRFEQTYAATGGLCRGVKAGGAWELPSLVTDVIPGK